MERALKHRIHTVNKDLSDQEEEQQEVLKLDKENVR